MGLTQSPNAIVSVKRRNLGRVSKVAIAPRWYPGKDSQGLFPCPTRQFLDKKAFHPVRKAPKFVQDSDVEFVIQALLQGRQTGAYGDLAPGGHEFLSRSWVQTPQNGKQRLFHALIPLNDATVKRRARYEDLRQLPSTLKPNDVLISLDVESAFFHVGIAPSHRKYFASHLAIPAFVKGMFIPLHPDGYWCCKVDNSPAHPSFDTPKHLQQYYYQVIEWSHYALALGWTASPRIWADVMKGGKLCSQEPRHSNNIICRRSPSRLRKPAGSIYDQRHYREDPHRLWHRQIADQGPMGTLSTCKFCSITSATLSLRKGLKAMCHCQSVGSTIYIEPSNTCYGWQQTTSA